MTVPESVEHIGSFAFLANDNLVIYFKSNTLPVYLDEDWDHGIKGYYLGVSSVVTDGDFKYATLTDGNIAILEYTGAATELDLNSLGYGNITVIGGDAFAYSSLESVTLPDTLVTIQKRAFYHSKLTSVTVPASVEFIGNSAFADTPIESLTFLQHENGEWEIVVTTDEADQNGQTMYSILNVGLLSLHVINLAVCVVWYLVKTKKNRKTA